MNACLLGYATGQFADARLEFAPRWIRHHAKIFRPQDIYIVGNNVNRNLFHDVNLIVRDHPDNAWYDVFWEMACVYEQIVRLRLKYNTVVFASMDEFLCLSSPLDYIVDQKYTPCLRIPTYDVIHDPLTEPAIDNTKSTLSQRMFWKFAPGSTHPSIFHDSLAMSLGCHSLAGVEPHNIPWADGAIWLHAKREDYHMLHARTRERIQWPWGDAQHIQGLSEQNKLSDDALDRWYFQDVNSVELTHTDFEEIP